MLTKTDLSEIKKIIRTEIRKQLKIEKRKIRKEFKSELKLLEKKLTTEIEKIEKRVEKINGSLNRSENKILEFKKYVLGIMSFFEKNSTTLKKRIKVNQEHLEVVN
ncbi:MAG: hypothetical protein M1268_01130 [Patescibacteria group bacterium]|nr:hypothetical protein [Patescibacteria group bacterium]